LITRQFFLLFEFEKTNRQRSEPTFLWLIQLRSYFLFAPNLHSNAKKIRFAATRMNSQALMWFQTWLEGVALDDLQSTFDEFADELRAQFFIPLMSNTLVCILCFLLFRVK
jgi:hypothetical protein